VTNAVADVFKREVQVRRRSNEGDVGLCTPLVPRLCRSRDRACDGLGREAVFEVCIRGYAIPFSGLKKEKNDCSPSKSIFKCVARCLVEQFFGLGFMGRYRNLCI